MSARLLQTPRAKQACEPCRRKKSKCPGERPVCSFCNRLNQTCTYARPTDDYRVRKSTDTDGKMTSNHSKDRVDALESRLHRMEEIMNIFSNGRTPGSLPDRETSMAPFTDTSPSRAPTDHNDRQDRFHVIEKIIPPSDILISLVDVYASRFSTSAFLVFDIEKLRSKISNFSELLLRSLLGLLVRVNVSEIPFFHNLETIAGNLYTNSACRMLFSEVSNPSRSLELLQAFCCACYSNIIVGFPPAALMTLGLAARYAFCTNFLNTNTKSSNSSTRDDITRCLWSLYYLDRTYGSSLNTIHVMPNLKELPELSPTIAKPSMPTPLHSRMDESDDDPLMNVQDAGIVTIAFKLLSIWGDLMSRLRQMRTDSQEKGWEAASAYQQIRAQVFDLECTYPQKHRFDFSRIGDRIAEEMAADRQYWDPWILSQMLYHGLHALLNHPVLHFFRKPDQRSVRPPSFQQQIIDHSILHSRWIGRLIELCQVKQFQVSDPFVGHIASTTATVLFFLSFSKDEYVVGKAIENFNRCEEFVGTMSQAWPHLINTKIKLAKLAAILPRTVQRNETRRPKVNEALIWNLLDYAASSSTEDSSRDVNDVVEVDVNTQHLSPLDPRTSRTAQATSPDILGVMTSSNVPPEWTQNEFSLDMLEIPDMPGFMLSEDYWTGGQL